ncbi:hypothetical protein [Leptonema illini]|jgi:hypothetical protein|uniref:Uncharacterized protein n=1 Tax=Leptonema illini DSM 21528 TaxID=929563 RepID=H2CAF0_9LEPT|nr:hypothetical protein [Leptonema illini]EHQ07317.1 hypothetical protein Lepil_2644 [Leptonema illini DSM 21528]
MKKILLTASLAVLLPTTSLLAEDSGLVRLLEVAATYGNTSKQGPETIGSILSSVRLANSLTSNTQEFFSETNKSGGSGYTPRIRYSHQFTDSFFVGLSYTRGADVFYDRTSVGNQGAYIKDKTKTRQYQAGIRFGAGPLDYLASESTEFSIGYEQNRQEGPYMTTGFRLPRYDSNTSSFTDLSLLFGNGTIDFHHRAFSLNFGASSTGDIFGFYVLGDFQFIGGSLTLTSHTLDTSIPASAVPSFVISEQPQLTYINFPTLQGMLMSMELGMIIKFTDSFGIRGGGYYQLAYIDYGVPKGFYYANGTWSEVSSSAELTSAEKRRQLGFWGFNFGVVTKL